MVLSVLRVCCLQAEEVQKQSPRACGAAPHLQGDGHSAAVSNLKHGCPSNEKTATPAQVLGSGAESRREHRTEVCARDGQTSSVGRPGSGRPSNLALNLGYYSEEEKQDQSKDEPPVELPQQGGREGQCCGGKNNLDTC